MQQFGPWLASLPQGTRDAIVAFGAEDWCDISGCTRAEWQQLAPVQGTAEEWEGCWHLARNIFQTALTGVSATADTE